MLETDTIAAISTAPGQAGIAIIRMSGPDSFRIADAVFDGRRKPSALPGSAFAHGSIRNGSAESAAVDEVILLGYRAPRSYTREDVVEIQGHGGQTCAARILAQLVSRGARPAEPGEFTKRAFLNGRIDLLQAEAVADLISARSDRAAVAAMDQLSGALSTACNVIYDDIVTAAADLEASFDFVEDELPETAMSQLLSLVSGCAERLQGLLEGWEAGRLVREGALVVITGRPNAGKSTLMNTLLGMDRAIVAAVPGTTRDTIEESIAIEGIAVRLMDTAGLRETDCEVEQEGVRRAMAATETADIRLHVVDISVELHAEGADYIQRLNRQNTILVLNKCDLTPKLDTELIPIGLTCLRTSLTGSAELGELKKAMIGKLISTESRPPGAVISERHRALVQSSLNELNGALEHLRDRPGEDPVLAAQGLRQALEFLGRITGREYSQELLDSIFSRFCIGK
jgi:tRNA modification GTPase